MWLTSLKWAAIVSIPICILLVVDRVLGVTYGWRIAPTPLYYAGMELYVLHSMIEGHFTGNQVAVCVYACLSDFLIIWLIAYVVTRVRRLFANRRAL